MNYRLLIIFLFVVVSGFYSCKQNDNPLPVPPTDSVNVVNATADTLNYFVNGTRQNNASPLYPGGATYYLNVISGSQNYQFKKNGSPVVLFNTVYKLGTGHYYSIFIGSESADKTFLTVDNLNAAAQVGVTDTSKSTAVIRFVNATPSANALNMIINKGDTVNIQNAAFKYISPFMLAKATTNEIKVYQAGNTTPLVDTLFTMQANQIYTIYSKGVLNGKGNSAFGIGLMLTGAYTNQ